MKGTLDIAVFPQPTYFNNPYQELLHAALERHGARVLPPRAPSVTWAGRASVDVVHLHWIEALLRSSPPRGPRREALPAHVRAARLVGMLKVLRRRRKRVVWTMHNLRPHEPYFPWLEERVTRAVLDSVDAVLVHSSYAEERVRDEFGWDGELHVVPHGHYIGAYPDETRGREELRQALGLPAQAFVYLVFGNLRPYKQVPAAIEAVKAVGASDVHLLVVGTPHPAVEGAIRSAGAGDERIHLHLRDVPDQDVAGYHLAADAALFNYRDVFSSGALLLALSFGLPVVAPSPSTATEVVGEPALEPFTDGDLVAALEAMRGSDMEQRRQAALAAAESYSWDRVAELTLRAYGVEDPQAR